jgi:glucose/arabinose dehydrogenase
MSRANTIDGENRFPALQKLLMGALGAILLLSYPASANAQQWKAALQTEQAQNASRLNQINEEGEPIAAQLRQNTAAVASHNAEHPDGTCTYPQGHREVCTPWIEEASSLNAKKEQLVSKLQPLVDEFDRVTARNEEIAQRLKCVPLPGACSSDAQCNECSSCSTFDGKGTSGICQPRP